MHDSLSQCCTDCLFYEFARTLRYDIFGDEVGMLATLGRVNEFDGTKGDDWPEYVERLEYFFEANGIDTAEKKRAVFLSVIGAATYRTLRNLVSPAKPGEKPFTELVEKHFKPAPSEIVERFKFHSRSRRPGESVATFVAELRCLAEFCNFGDTLEVMLRDLIVCGINDDGLQRHLLAQPALDYNKAVESAMNMEAAAKSVRELRVKQETHGSGPPTPQQVHRTGTYPSQEQGGVGKSGPTCYRCGTRGHTVVRCRVDRNVVCHKCGKKGHLQRVCKSSARSTRTGPGKSRAVCRVEEEEEEEEEKEHQAPDLSIYIVKSSQVPHSPPIHVKVKLDECLVTMEVDTGAAVTLMSEATFANLWPGRELHPSRVRLQAYSGEPIPVVGCSNVNMDYEGQCVVLPLYVVAGCGPTLLGRDWLSQVRLNWQQIHHVHTPTLQALLTRFPAVFQEGLGTLKGYQAKIHVDPNATPRYNQARSVSYAFREKVELELQRLQNEGTLEPVEFADWAAPIVTVLKKDKSSIRICGDFSTTVNPVSKVDRYPIPKVCDLFAKLGKGKQFSKLDLSHAYQQVPLDEESRKYVVINTHKGLFRYTRLPFGIASAPGIFQRVIESVLQGIEGVIVYLDDILITGSTEEEHLHTLEEVLSRLEQAGLRARRSKCVFMRPSVIYLGHRIDAEGLHPLDDRVRAIWDAPLPTSVSELKSFLGMLSYYSKFLPGMSSTLHPLYHLLKKNVSWTWKEAQAQSFTASKQLLTSSSCLIHYNPMWELTLACDASSYGLGAVISHKMPDGTERPVAYASRTLNAAERNYSQLEKEGLSCIFGIKRFHDYLFGRHFELVTDHKPLLGLLREDRAIPLHASSRIKRWALFLSNYEYSLVFRNTTAHANADALSRLPLPEEPATSHPEPELVLLAEHLADSPVTAQDIRRWTQRDRKLSRVFQFVQQGWPSEGDTELEPYSSRRLELSTYEGCILWGSRVVIPPPGRQAVLQELHEGHPGMTRMKALSRMYVWWPGIGQDIEKSVRLCSQCQVQQSLPPVAPLNPWKWPTRPWARLHLDFAGPFEGKNILIIIDAHSKWIEATCTPSTSSSSVIDVLRSIFARFGLPETIVTDNGTGFVSQEFKEFLRMNGIHHTTSAPYHPASNGLAERAVQIVKKGLKKDTAGSMVTRLARVLFTYRITPQSTTGSSPAELLLGRRPRTRLDLLKPNTAERVEQKQRDQKAKHDKKAKARQFGVGDHVFVKNHGVGERWVPGVIREMSGPVSFHVELEDGRHKRCHQDHLRFRVVDDGPAVSAADESIAVGPPAPEVTSDILCPASSDTDPPLAQPDARAVAGSTRSSSPSPTVSIPPNTTESVTSRYPQRNRKSREWFEPGTN